jgi:hypothetical protein
MAKLDFFEKDLIDQLFIDSGYVLDFTNRTFQSFIYESIQIDIYSKYPNLSKGKILRAILDENDDIDVGKVLLQLLKYMQVKNFVNDNNKLLFEQCAEIGNRLIGRSTKTTTSRKTPKNDISPITTSVDYNLLLLELQELSNFPDTPQGRGFAFEKYLNSLFFAFSLKPRGSFRVEGEQIDGSFELKNEIYLLEARWRSKQINKSDLVVFNEKVGSKSPFTRGLFISFSEYSKEAISSFAIGREVKIILMTVQELAISLSKKYSLDAVLWNKVRALAEQGDFNKSVMEMIIK